MITTTHIHTVQIQHMKMHVQIQCTPESLDEDHCACAGGAARVSGPPQLVGGNSPIHDAQHLAHYGRSGSEQEPQGIREAQPPLPN